MRVDEITMVYPGGDTRCLFSSSPEYAFQVVPGRTDKLLLHFQGGGLCWDELSTSAVKPRPCVTYPKLQPLCGIFDRTKASSPFRDYTIVHVQQCSGDLHAGAATRWYLDPRGVPVKQRGYHNAKSAIDWAKANLDQRLTSLVLSGTSSGAVGAQLWAAQVLKQFEYNSAAVLADSYAGLLPERAQGSLLKSLGICKARLLGDRFAAACRGSSLNIPDVFNEAMRAFPRVAFASINSKADWSQIEFYKGIAQQNLLPADMSDASYLNRLNTILERYNANSNYVSYLVTGNDNGFLPKPLLYTTDTSGANGTQAGESSSERVPLAAWLAKLPLAEGRSIATACSGPVLARADWSGASYCDAAFAGKVFAPSSVSSSARSPRAEEPAARVQAPLPLTGTAELATWGPLYYWGLGILAAALCFGAAVESYVAPRRTHFLSKERKSRCGPSSDEDSELLEAAKECCWSDNHLAQPLPAAAGPLPSLRPFAPLPTLAPLSLAPGALQPAVAPSTASMPAATGSPAATGAPAKASPPLRLQPPTQAMASPPVAVSPLRVASPPAAASPLHMASPAAVLPLRAAP